MSAKAPTRAPDHAHYSKQLSKLGWYMDREVRHGKMYRSPNGKHTFVLSKNIERCDWRGVKNDIARLRREGGEALALANALTGREYDIHLPKIDPTAPPQPNDSYLAAERELMTDLGGLDPAQLRLVQPVVTAAIEAEIKDVERTIERRAAVAEPEVETTRPSMRQLSPTALRRVAIEVITIIANRYDGELTMDKVDTQRAVTAGLYPYVTYSKRHTAIGVSYGEEQGWLDSYWPHGPGSRTGRTRITVTAAGYAEIGMAPPEREPDDEQRLLDEARERINRFPTNQPGFLPDAEEEPSERERELLELLELAEAERDDAKAEAKEAREELEKQRSLTVQFERRADELTRLLEAGPSEQPWNDRVLGAAVLVLRQADGCPANPALIEAAIAVLSKAVS